MPKIYQNTIDKKIKNNKTAYYSNSSNKIVQEKSDIMSQAEISSFINQLFDEDKHVFNIPVIIKTHNHTYDTSLVTRNNSYILTFDQDRINIDEIISIQRKNHS